MTGTILFVCPHGAGKSRMAAAFFNRVTPSGWQAISAGQEPARAVNPDTVRLLAGNPVETLLDRDPPRPITAVEAPERVIAIDCEVPGAECWTLAQQEIDESMRDERRERAEALAREIGRGHGTDGRG